MENGGGEAKLDQAVIMYIQEWDWVAKEEGEKPSLMEVNN